VRRSEYVTGYVIHERAFGEGSRVIDCLTREHGRIAIMAKGVRQPGRKERPAPFVPFRFELGGQGELKLLKQLESLSNAPALSGVALLAGLYFNELLLSLLPRDDPHPGLFQCYQEGLASLSKQLALSVRRFEWQLLLELGYAPDFERDAEGEALSSERRYRFVFGSGLRADHNGELEGAMLIALRSGHDEFAKPQREFLHGLLRICLEGKELKSWAMLKELAALKLV
jgi:DNA repair protein RecO (recombination protein O)